VGAGDGFAAGVISGVMEGLPLAQAVQRGSAIGTIQIMHVSDNEGLPSREAVDAGAKAVISPGTNLETVRWCLRNGVPVIPGCATPSEVESNMREGLKLVKLFPAEVVGVVGMLKAMAGSYAAMKFMPTGGVKPGNVQNYLRLANVTACGGTWIVPGELLSTERFDEIERLAREAESLRDQVR